MNKQKSLCRSDDFSVKLLLTLPYDQNLKPIDKQNYFHNEKI